MFLLGPTPTTQLPSNRCFSSVFQCCQSREFRKHQRKMGPRNSTPLSENTIFTRKVFYHLKSITVLAQTGSRTF